MTPNTPTVKSVPGQTQSSDKSPKKVIVRSRARIISRSNTDIDKLFTQVTDATIATVLNDPKVAKAHINDSSFAMRFTPQHSDDQAAMALGDKLRSAASDEGVGEVKLNKKELKTYRSYFVSLGLKFVPVEGDKKLSRAEISGSQWKSICDKIDEMTSDVQARMVALEVPKSPRARRFLAATRGRPETLKSAADSAKLFSSGINERLAQAGIDVTNPDEDSVTFLSADSSSRWIQRIAEIDSIANRVSSRSELKLTDVERFTDIVLWEVPGKPRVTHGALLIKVDDTHVLLMDGNNAGFCNDAKSLIEQNSDLSVTIIHQARPGQAKGLELGLKGGNHAGVPKSDGQPINCLGVAKMYQQILAQVWNASI